MVKFWQFQNNSGKLINLFLKGMYTVNFRAQELKGFSKQSKSTVYLIDFIEIICSNMKW